MPAMETTRANLVPSRRRQPRIAIGGILHETNTFAPFTTTLEDFRARVLLRGEGLLQALATGPGAAAGAFAAAGEATVLPLLFASATPGGPVTAEAFAELADELLDRLRWGRRKWPGIDGVVLFLHGAMVTTSDPDPEGTLLHRIRAEVGSGIPVVAVIDSHANVTARMVAAADALVAYRAYPHTDTFARGQEAMRLCLQLVRSGDRLQVAWRKLPLMMPLLAQTTIGNAPFRPVVALADTWRDAPGITSVSLVPGFPYADTPAAGGSVLVYADEIERAAAAVQDLADCWWQVRRAFAVRGVSLAAVPTTPDARPTVLAEISDNPGAGGAGDATHLLRHLLDGPFQHVALATLHDPAAVDACHAAGVGANLTLSLGGHAHPSSGSPITAEWTVAHLGDGNYVNEGGMSTGARGALGRTATVVRGTVSVILNQQRAQTLDPGVFRAGGVEPEHCQWLAVKSSVHYRAGFQALAGRMIDVESAGLSPSNLQSLEFARVMRPMVPLDDVDWSAALGPVETRS